MSRAERRQYQRMTKGQDPYASPKSTRGRRPPRRGGPKEARDWSFTRGFWLKSIGVAAVVGLIALSVAWPSGAEGALIAAVVAFVAAFALLVAVRIFLQRRAPAA